MKLLVLPEDGMTAVVNAIKAAKTSIDTTIFRFDRAEIEKALEAAVGRGVKVRTLIAHTNRGGDKLLRKLELRLLGAGVTVARSGEDLARYHAKFMVVDGRTLIVMLFNFTALDAKSRSFGVITTQRAPVLEAMPALRGRRDQAGVRSGAQGAGRQPRQRARSSDRVSQGREEVALDLRPEDQRQRHGADPRGAGAERRGCQGAGHRRQARQAVQGRPHEVPAPARARDHPRWARRLLRQPEPADGRARQPPGSRADRQGREGR